jgi:hypothetical protein
MNEPSGREHNAKEIYDILTELRVDIGVIKTQVGYFSEVKTTAENADGKAEKAMALAEENSRDIAEMKANNQFRFNVMVGAILTITGFLVTIGVAIFN